MYVHSVLIPKTKRFESYIERDKELKRIGVKPIKWVHVSSKYYRYRITTPNNKDDFYTKNDKHGIKIVMEGKFPAN